MTTRDKIPKHTPCYTCLLLAVCINKTLSDMFDECPILMEWYLKKEDCNNGIPRDSDR